MNEIFVSPRNYVACSMYSEDQIYIQLQNRLVYSITSNLQLRLLFRTDQGIVDTKTLLHMISNFIQRDERSKRKLTKVSAGTPVTCILKPLVSTSVGFN